MKKEPGFYRFPNKDIERQKNGLQLVSERIVMVRLGIPLARMCIFVVNISSTASHQRTPTIQITYRLNSYLFPESNKKSELKLKRLERATKRANSKKTVVTHLSQSDMVTGENSTKSGEENTLGNTAEKELEALSTTLAKLESERDQLKDSNANLQVECDSVRSEKMSACQTIQQMMLKFLSFGSLKAQPKKFKYYTGISVDIFEVIFDYLKGYLPDNSKAKLSHEDQLLMKLVKLRLNSRWVSLADQFKSNKNIFKQYLLEMD